MGIGRRRLFLAVSLLTACGPVLRADDAAVKNRPVQTESGWLLVQKAAAIYAADRAPKGSPDAGEEVLTPADNLARQRATIARDAEALSLIQQALAAGIVRPAGMTFGTEDHAAMRALTRLLAQESRVCAADEDWSGAARSALNIIDLFTQLPHGGALIHALVSASGESSGVRELRTLEPSLPASVAKQCAAALLQLDATRVTPAEIVRGDRAYTWSLISKEFASPNWSRRAVLLGKYDDLPDEARAAVTRVDYEATTTMTKEDIAAEFDAHTDLIVAWAKPTLPGEWNKGPRLPPARFPLTRMCDAIWTNRDVVFTGARSAANTRLLATKLAADAFHAERKRWPDSLNELVPEYLPAVPVDPFSGRALCYKLKDGAPLLYSVGPDGVDDGGKTTTVTEKPAIDVFANPPGLPPRTVTPTIGRTTKNDGDFVYGTNF